MKIAVNLGKSVLVFLVLLMMPVLVSAYNLSDSLVAYYEFENNYTDLTGSGNDGSLYGNVSFVTGFNSTTGIHIDDRYSYIDLGNGTDFQITGDITITAWLYLDAIPNWNTDYYFFVSKGYDGEFDLYYTPYATPSPQIRMVKTGTTGLVSDTLATDGWVFLAYTTSIGTDNFTSYQNGTMTATESGVQGVVSETSTPVLLGNRGDDASDDSIYGSNMTMDNVGIWSRALSDEEISALFNGSSPLPEIPTAEPYLEVTLISPADNETGVSLTPNLSAMINDTIGEYVNVTFFNASDDSSICYFENQTGNITLECNWTGVTSYNTLYSWYVNATDNANTTQSETRSFTTQTTTTTTITPTTTTISTTTTTTGNIIEEMSPVINGLFGVFLCLFIAGVFFYMKKSFN